jgi:4-hydroxybutyryl-CoA dehydratase/vinylacetyl-CoA-Delta-isomerase
MQLGYKKKLAKNLASVKETTESEPEQSDYFQRVFKMRK